MHQSRSEEFSIQMQPSNQAIKVYITEILLNPLFLYSPPDIFAEAVGVWVLCLLHCWIAGRIPQDQAQLARLLRLPEKVIARAWPIIKPAFAPDAHGFLIYPRLEADRKEALDLSLKRRASAHESWNRRRELPSETCGPDPTESLPQGPASRTRRRPRAPESPLAHELVAAWNDMANTTGGRLSTASLHDLPQNLDQVVEDLGGRARILDALDRIPRIPFYLGAGPHGWRASLPWLFQKKSIGNLLAQSLDVKAPDTEPQAGLSDADRALLAQIREGTELEEGGARA